jgi:hypothetical protein
MMTFWHGTADRNRDFRCDSMASFGVHLVMNELKTNFLENKRNSHAGPISAVPAPVPGPTVPHFSKSA